MKTLALIQARLGSTRLPLKGLLHFRGEPLINWVVKRVRRSELLDGLVAALPDNPGDDILAEHLRGLGVDVFRGPENDVLARFHLAAQAFGATHVVRVCADNPLVWGEEIDHLIRAFHKLGGGDDLYVYNHIPLNNRYPDGLGAEMISAALLQTLHEKAGLPAHREHCLLYIRDHAENFRIHTFDPPNPALRRPEIKLDVDTPADFLALARLPLRIDLPPAEIVRLFPAAHQPQM